MEPVILLCAPNGARKSAADHPVLPISPDELADCAESILAAGASVMHVHVRDDDGGHSLDVERYQDAIAAIRQRVGDKLVLQATTEACGIYSATEQMRVVRELMPEAVSLALQELCPDETLEEVAGEFFAELNTNNIMAQYILYSPQEVARFVSLKRKGVIPDSPAFVLFVLGRYSDDLTGDPEALTQFVDAIQDEAVWAVCCFGRTEAAAVAKAVAIGGHARVGFENNLLLPDGRTAADNAELVHLAASNSGERSLANADDVRQYFGRH